MVLLYKGFHTLVTVLADVEGDDLMDGGVHSHLDPLPVCFGSHKALAFVDIGLQTDVGLPRAC
jgi:hypothetical protein